MYILIDLINQKSKPITTVRKNGATSLPAYIGLRNLGIRPPPQKEYCTNAVRISGVRISYRIHPPLPPSLFLLYYRVRR